MYGRSATFYASMCRASKGRDVWSRSITQVMVYVGRVDKTKSLGQKVEAPEKGVLLSHQSFERWLGGGLQFEPNW